MNESAAGRGATGAGIRAVLAGSGAVCSGIWGRGAVSRRHRKGRIRHRKGRSATGGGGVSELADWIGGLTLAEGEGAGGPFPVLPWQRRFIGRLEREDGDLALSMGRGNGKTAFSAALALAAVFGPLRRPGGGDVVLVASSFDQAKIAFDHCLGYLGPADVAALRRRDSPGRVQDHGNRARIEWRGVRLRCIGSDPRRAHGLAPVLVIADELAQWPGTSVDKMLKALSTSMGKVRGSRMVSIGTRPADPEHPFSRMLAGDGGTVYAARPGDPPFQRRTWARANPSLDAMPALEERIRYEADKARRDSSELQGFRALRLNLGVGEVEEAVLFDPAAWAAIEVDHAERSGPFVLGLDLGGSAAMSAAAAYWPETGALDAFGCFCAVPPLAERGLADGVGGAYVSMQGRGELIVAGEHVSDVGALLGAVLERWGAPAAVVGDRYRDAELREKLVQSGFPSCPLVTRGMGWRDGAEDVRRFKAAALGGKVHPGRSLLLRSAVGGARLVTDAAGNQKLSKGSAGGRRRRHRDDAAAAAILAAAHGSRVAAVQSRPRAAPVMVRWSV